MPIAKTPFGTLPDGRAATLFTLTNANGLAARITDFGGHVVSILAPGRDGRAGEVTLGFGSVDGYVARPKPTYWGALVGRFANRIARGRFTLDGKEYALATNDGDNHLHGGRNGFDQKLWTAAVDGNSLRLLLDSPDGDEGYPGRLSVAVHYSLADDGGLSIAYAATTDAPTIVNLTNHAFFNLTAGPGDVNGHELRLAASRYTPVSEKLIPTGALAPVADTPFDFRTAKPVGRDLARVSGGYDHNFVLDRDAPGLFSAALARDPESGRTLEVLTTEPGLQFYGGNFLDGTLLTADGRHPGKHGAFCLEAQRFPDAPNQPAFPSAVLRPGTTYRQTTVYRFGADR